MYNDAFFVFANTAEFNKTKADVEALPQEQYAVDVVGVVAPDEGYPAKESFFVNMRVAEGNEVPSFMLAYQIEAPKHPKRVWA